MFAGIVALAVEVWLVFINLKSKLHAYLLLSCIAMLINNIGYVLELLSKSEEAYITALKLSYLGRVFIAYTLLMFAAELCRIQLPSVVKRVLLLIHIGVYICILTIGSNGLYYSSYSFDTSGIFPILYHENGPAHYLISQIQIFYVFIALYWLFSTLNSEKNHTIRKRLWMIIVAYFLESAFYIIQLAPIPGFVKQFDISIIGNVALTFFMFIAIFRYDLLGITEIAREFMIDRLSEGVIAVDNKGKVAYFNMPAQRLYPALSFDPETVVEEIRKAISEGETIKVNDRIYTPEENDLIDNKESFGKLYALVDSTVLKLKEYKLKSDAQILKMAAGTMRERLLTAEELMQQDRAMRHDRRHFEALLLSLLRDGKSREAQNCLEERLAQEPRSAARYCENTTVNAAITHYVHNAKSKNIEVIISANIPVALEVDEMQLAIAISNLLENAIHECEKLPENERRIEITAKYKQQLLLEITNTCEGTVPLDDEGHPYSTMDDHGIGTKSVIAFANNTGSEIRYIASDGLFKVQMII